MSRCLISEIQKLDSYEVPVRNMSKEKVERLYDDMASVILWSRALRENESFARNMMPKCIVEEIEGLCVDGYGI